VKLNVVRLLWVFPALGCVGASYFSCLLDRGQEVKIVPRRAASR
jgi:hypothetical protein